LVETLTESFCERCGTRYEFTAPTRLNPLRKTRGIIGGFKNYLTSQDALSDAMGDAMRGEEAQLASAQLEAFHESFNFCIGCRQYTCLNCWNDDAGHCRSCAPIAGTDDLGERLAASFHGAAAGLAPEGEPSAMSSGDVERRLGPGAWPESDMVVGGGNGHGTHVEAWPETDAARDAIADAVASPTEDEPATAASAPEEDAVFPDVPAAVTHERAEAEFEAEVEPLVAHADSMTVAPVAGSTAAAPADGWDPTSAGEAVEPAAADADSWLVAADASVLDEPPFPSLDGPAAPGQADPVAAEVEPIPEPPRILRVAAWEADAAYDVADPTPLTSPELHPEAREPEPELVVEFDPEPEYVAEVEPDLTAGAQADSELAAEAVSQPEPMADVEPQAEPDGERPPAPSIGPISETILRFPQQQAQTEPSQPVAAEDESPEVAARRAQLDLLGLGDPGEGPVPTEQPAVLPYRSRGAAVSSSQLGARPGGFWEASAREVAGAAANIGVQSCGQCGLSLSANARFCRRCGTRQAQSA
jgi:hypothetical protein